MTGAKVGHLTMPAGAQCHMDVIEIIVNVEIVILEYKFRYAPETRGGPGIRGRNPNPDAWQTGPCRIAHDKHYGFLKHKAQANYRNEEYTLTLEQWETMWNDEDWIARGRKSDNMCMQQITPGKGWHLSNVEVVPRRKHFSDIKRRNRDV
tara:strand:- start:1636 stop:2085 length:450 start_codon:yes stop_codon:yes gene_type:complete